MHTTHRQTASLPPFLPKGWGHGAVDGPPPLLLGGARTGGGGRPQSSRPQTQRRAASGTFSLPREGGQPQRPQPPAPKATPESRDNPIAPTPLRRRGRRQTRRLHPHSTGPPLDQGHGVSLPSSFGDVLPSALAYSAFPPVSVCGTAFAACGGKSLRCGVEAGEVATAGKFCSGPPTAPYNPRSPQHCRYGRRRLPAPDVSSRSRREGSHLSVRTRAQPAADPRSTSRRRAHSATVSPGLGAFRRSVHSFRQSPDCSPQYPLKPFGERLGVRTLGPYSPRSRTTEPRKPREFGGED